MANYVGNGLLMRAARLLVAALALGTVVVWCQSSNGSVRGEVHDQTKAVIPGVSVVLTNTDTNVDMRTTTNSVGLYVFPSAIPGPYKVVVEFAGMKKFEGTLTVRTQESEVVDVTMLPASTATAITVHDVTPLVKSDSPDLGHTLEQTQIQELPINGRLVANLLNTVPGLTGDRAYGVRLGTHDLLLDGAPLTDELNGGLITRQPGLEGIQEFNVTDNADSAKFTRQTSIILTTKSGTNQLHGSLFETNRNDSIGLARTRDNLTNTAAPYVRNEFGGSVGGPVYIPKVYNGKNKSFWFVTYEQYRLRDSTNGQFSVPTAAMRNGDFSAVRTATGGVVNLYNPYTTDATTHLRQQFNYNGVLNAMDPSLESPLAKALYATLPLPTFPNVNPLAAANYYGLMPDIYNQGMFSTRFDQRLGDNDTLYVRISNNSSNRNHDSLGVPTLDKVDNWVQTLAPNKSITAHYNHIFSPTFFNEVMFSATSTLGSSTTGDQSELYANLFGLPNPNNQIGYPVIDQIGVGGGYNGNYYFQSVNALNQRFAYFILEDNATKIKGRHELQFGAHLRYDQLTYLPQQSQTGGFVSFPAISTAQYDPTVPSRSQGVLNTGSIGAAFYLGQATYTYPIVKQTYYMRQHEDAFYFQDNFRVSSRLMLNLGVRWQFTPFPMDKHDTFTSFDVNNMAIVTPTGLNTLYQQGVATPAYIQLMESYGARFETAQQAGIPTKLVYNNWHDLSPHVGFAYRALQGKKSFVVRGGTSLNYYPLPMYLWNDSFRADAPFKESFTNSALTLASQSPDGQQNYGLVSVPTIVAGKNSANAINLSNPSAITPGGTSFAEYFFDPHQPTARVQDWNLTIEKELMQNTILRVGYVGNYAWDEEIENSLNASIPSWVWYNNTHSPLPTGTYSAAAIRPLNVQSNGTILPYGEIQEFTRAGWSSANGVQVELERRLSKGMGFQVFYNMINAEKMGANGYASDSTLLPATSFATGAVPTDMTQRANLLLKERDTTIPKQQIHWNWVVDLPLGRGKQFGGHMNRVLDAVVGGWQLTSMGTWSTNYFTIPTTNYPTGAKVQSYGHKYPVQDCTSGKCIPGYLLWNAYIPAQYINSHNAAGLPNGIEGVPANYQPAEAPLYPYPANYLSLNSTLDPNYGLYGTNTVNIPLSTGAQQPVAYGALNSYINQFVSSTNIWSFDTSLGKNFHLTERVRLRLQMDAFNTVNVPGNSYSPGTYGIAYTNTNVNTPRQLQLAGHLYW
jgi:hypothetical protein